MNAQLYKLTKVVGKMLWYEATKYDWDDLVEKTEINREYILDLLNKSQLHDKKNIEISDTELDFLVQYAKSTDRNEYLKECIEREFSNMSTEKMCMQLIDLMNNGIYDEVFFNSAQKIGVDAKILLDNIDNLNESAKNRIISMVKFEDILNYINENGSQKESVLKWASEIKYDDEMLQKIIDGLQADSDKAKVIILSNVVDDSKKDKLYTIENSFFRNLIVKQTSEYVYKRDELITQIDEFKKIRGEFEELETEEEKAEFITTLNNYDMRLELLSNIKKRENRDLVINSFECEIDPDLKPQVELVQKMIRNYFEDTLQDKFDEEKRERMEIVFNKSDVVFKDLEGQTNGRASYLFDSIQISTRHKNNINKTLGFLIHEYEHLFSRYEFKTKASRISHTIDEGTADLFADLVINHNLEKYGKIELNGRRVRVDSPYETYSGYDFENAWQRTILYGLSKDGKDAEALGEYILGDKYKYLELTLGPEIAAQKHVDNFGEPDLETNWEEIYESPKTDFSQIDNNSIYARRNFILPMYELQNKLKSKGINILDGKHYLAKYIGNQYFDGRKIFEISREEMTEFYNLYMKQNNPRDASNSPVVQYDKFVNSKLQEITDEEIHDYSFEILDTAIGLTGNEVILGTYAEKLTDKLIQREIELIEEGQTIETSIKKYKTIIPDHLKKIKPEIDDSNRYAYDYIQNLKFSYMEQIRQALEEGRSQTVISALTEKGEIYLDNDIREIFSEYGVKIRKKRI